MCVWVNRKIVLICGKRPENWKILKRRYIFDFVSAKWRRGADMPTLRHDFACSVSSSTGLIYVAGGRDNRFNALLATEAYNVEQNTWEILPPMNQPVENCCGLLIEERFFVFNQKRYHVLHAAKVYNVEEDMWEILPPMTQTNSLYSAAEIFDPNTGVWKRMHNMRGLVPSLESALVVSGHLYTLSERQLMKYDAQKNDWIPETSIPATKFPPTACTAEWRGHIFLSNSCMSSRRQVCGVLNPSTKELGFSTPVATVEI